MGPSGEMMLAGVAGVKSGDRVKSTDVLYGLKYEFILDQIQLCSMGQVKFSKSLLLPHGVIGRIEIYIPSA